MNTFSPFFRAYIAWLKLPAHIVPLRSCVMHSTEGTEKILVAFRLEHAFYDLIGIGGKPDVPVFVVIDVSDNYIFCVLCR